MLPSAFVVLAVLLRLGAGAGYVRAVVTGRARPNPVTWFCWGLAPLVAFAAQADDGVGAHEWMTLALAVGPMVIFATSVVKGRSWGRPSAFDLACGLLAVAGVAAWQATSSPSAALVFGIAADLAGATPTLRQAYRRPWDEYAAPYLISASSMVITLLTIEEWAFVPVAFAAYILAINLTIFVLVKVRTAVAVPEYAAAFYVPFVERNLDTHHDAAGSALDGGRQYVVRVTADPRARLGWSMTACAAATGGNLDTVRHRSADHPAVEVHFGPMRPVASDAVWIRTVPGQAWFARFHLYGPHRPDVDAAWRVDNLTLAQ